MGVVHHVYPRRGAAMSHNLRFSDEELDVLINAVKRGKVREGRASGEHPATRCRIPSGKGSTLDGVPDEQGSSGQRSLGGTGRQRSASSNAAPLSLSSQTFFIPGRLPGLNEVLAAANQRKGKWNGYDQLKREWGARIERVLTEAKLQPMPRVTLEFIWCEPNMKRDKDNVAMGKKFVLDALVAAKVIPNDGWRHVVGFTDGFLVDKANPGVQVTLAPAGA